VWAKPLNNGSRKEKKQNRLKLGEVEREWGGDRCDIEGGESSKLK
jgi:hypothetical protein